MILRVLDRDGSVIHDCRALHCETSWDGVVIATGLPADGRVGDGIPPGYTVQGDEARRD